MFFGEIFILFGSVVCELLSRKKETNKFISTKRTTCKSYV